MMPIKAVIIDGCEADDEVGSKVRGAISDHLTGSDHAVTVFALRELRIAPCQGCFGCWVRSPGRCVIDDDGRVVATSWATAQLAVFLTPVVFGGYSPHLKAALDRQLGSVLPLFRVVNNEIHHPPRYGGRQALVAIGVQDRPDSEARDIFCELVRRNALNAHYDPTVCRVLSRDQQLPLEGLASEVLREAGVSS